MNVYKFLEEFRNRYYNQLRLVVDRYDSYKDKSLILQDTFLEKYCNEIIANYDPHQSNAVMRFSSLGDISIEIKFDTWLNKDIHITISLEGYSSFTIIFRKDNSTIKFRNNVRYISSDRKEYREYKVFILPFSWLTLPEKTLNIDEDVSMAILSDDQRITLSIFDSILSQLEN